MPSPHEVESRIFDRPLVVVVPPEMVDLADTLLGLPSNLRIPPHAKLNTLSRMFRVLQGLPTEVVFVESVQHAWHVYNQYRDAKAQLPDLLLLNTDGTLENYLPMLRGSAEKNHLDYFELGNLASKLRVVTNGNPELTHEAILEALKQHGGELTELTQAEKEVLKNLNSFTQAHLIDIQEVIDKKADAKALKNSINQFLEKIKKYFVGGHLDPEHYQKIVFKVRGILRKNKEKLPQDFYFAKFMEKWTHFAPYWPDTDDGQEGKLAEITNAVTMVCAEIRNAVRNNPQVTGYKQFELVNSILRPLSRELREARRSGAIKSYQYQALRELLHSVLISDEVGYSFDSASIRLPPSDANTRYMHEDFRTFLESIRPKISEIPEKQNSWIIEELVKYISDKLSLIRLEYNRGNITQQEYLDCVDRAFTTANYAIVYRLKSEINLDELSSLLRKSSDYFYRDAGLQNSF